MKRLFLASVEVEQTDPFPRSGKNLNLDGLYIFRPFFASCNCLMTSSRSAASVAVVTRKEPSRVKVVLLASKVAVTPHSFSRFCFRSRQAANAQPTA